MNKPLSGALLCVLLAVMPAEAQTYHDNPTIVSGVVPIPANIGGVANGVAVSSTSSATSLPASGSIYPAININNAGSVTAYVQLGASTTTSAGAAIPAGGNACLSAGGATQLAAITASSTTTLNITQANACIQGAGGGGGGGGGGGCSSPCVVTQPTASLLNVTEANSAPILTQLQLLLGAPTSYNSQTTPDVPTIQAAAYSSGNAIGGLQTVAFFRTATQPGATLDQFALEWAGGETVATTVYLFNKNPMSSTCTDKTGFSLAATDAKQLVTPPFALTAAASAGATQTFASQALAVSAKNLDSTATANLYVCLVVGGAVTPAVGDLSLTISGVLD
jgi:hypothetical protein